MNLTLEKIKSTWLPFNINRRNNFSDARDNLAIYNDSINLFDAIALVAGDASTGATDITISQSSGTVTVESSSGTDGSIPSATTSLAGVMSASDKTNLGALVTLSGVSAGSTNLGTFTGATIANSSTIKSALQALETAVEAIVSPTGTDLSITFNTGALTLNSSTGTDVLLPVATITNNGLLSAADKVIVNTLNTNVPALISLSGVAAAATNLGTFSGSTISNNTTIKDALQSLETAVEAIPAPDGNGIYDGSGVIPAATVATTSGAFTIQPGSASHSIRVGDAGASLGGWGLDVTNSTGIGLGNIYAGGFSRIDLQTNLSLLGRTANDFIQFTNVGSKIKVSNTSMVMEGSNVAFQGLVYNADYSANYSSRSLVDKEYVDAAIGASGGGTVTSIGLTMPSGFTVSSSPITTAGTIGVTTALSGVVKASGGAFTAGTVSLSSEVSGTLPIARGGTGLTALGTANQLVRVNSGATALEYFTPTYISANQTITLSGDVTGSGTTAITTTIATDAVTTSKILDANVTMAKIAQASATTGQAITWNGSAWAPGSPLADAAGAQGDIQFRASTDVLAANTLINWNDSTNRLRVGFSTAPTARLHVQGEGATSATHPFIVQNSGATQILTVRDDQRVGIKASVPLTPLHVNGIVAAGDSVSASNSVRGLNVVDTTIPSIRVISVNATPNTTSPLIELMARATADGTNTVYWDMRGTTNGYIIRDQGAALDRLQLKTTGQLQLHAYNTTTFDTNSPTKALGVDASGNAVTFTPAVVPGSNTEIIFNNTGAFGASSLLTWNGSTLQVSGAATITGQLNLTTNSQYAINQSNSGSVNRLAAPTYIGSTGSAPVASAILELESTTKALLLTRMTGTGSIASPADGMLFYDNTLGNQRFLGRINSAWVPLNSPVSVLATPVADQFTYWSTGGSSPVIAGSANITRTGDGNMAVNVNTQTATYSNGAVSTGDYPVVVTSSNIGAKSILSMKSGAETAKYIQEALWKNRWSMWDTGISTNGDWTLLASSSVTSAPNYAGTNLTPWGQVTLTTAASSGDYAHIINTNPNMYLRAGNVSTGGFYFFCRFVPPPTFVANARQFIGMSSYTGVMPTNPLVNWINTIGLYFDGTGTTGNYSVILNGNLATTGAVTSTTSTSVTTSSPLEFTMYWPNGGTAMYWSLKTVSTGAVTTGTLTPNPASSLAVAALHPKVYIAATSGSAVTLPVHKIYCSSENDKP